jgi:signal transduction histidine kinase
MVHLRDQLRRWAVRLLARRRGEVRAMQDLRHLQEVLRFAGVFAVLMLLPTIFLAWQALSSVRSEELSLDADLQARARAMTSTIEGELEGIFLRFEAATLERLRRGESPTSNLGELSPYLRAAFRFDATGELAAPFDLPTPDLAPEPSAAWRSAARTARGLERDDPAEAVQAWRAAQQATTQPALVAEALLGEARSLASAGRNEEADERLADLYSDYAGIRGRRGFRMGDLALLERAEIRLARDEDDVARSILEGLVDQLLAAQWTIGREGEAAVVRMALERLQKLSDPDWLARARSRLNERYTQLLWSENVVDELELVYSRIPESEFRYLGARIDSPGVWGIVRAGDSFYAFSFSVQALYDDLLASVARTDELEADLSARLYLPSEEVPDEALSVRGLGPWLPVVTLSVEPSDPEALALSKNRRRTMRVAVVLTAVFVSVVGAFWVARLIAWEVEAARQRADFAANVSHELRSPITQIRLKGEALQLGLVDPGDDMQQHFDAIVREAERLSRLVDNVLDFAAIERGAKRYHPRPDDLNTVVYLQVEAARSSMAERDIELVLELPEDLPPLWIDREAMGQVLTNLLSNAAKYGADGKWVRVRVEQVDDSVELSVADRGMGIAEDELHRVFDDFFRSGDPAVRKRKGTGIGLAIVRYIVEAHGGTIRVDSAPGQGATFTITLPLEPPEGLEREAN